MPLTRNLYREDEVLVAVQWCIMRGRLKESMFWAQELIDSELTLELLQTLFYVWINFAGTSHFYWLTWFKEAIGELETISEADIQYLVFSLAKAMVNKPDSSVFALLGIGFDPTEIKKPIEVVVLPPSLKSLKGSDKTFAIALKLGKPALALASWPSTNPALCWSILQTLNPVNAMISLLETDLEAIWKPEWKWFVNALAILSCCGTSSSLEKPRSDLPVELQPFCDELKELTQRSRRLYSVPPDCLYWFTERGSNRVNKTIESEIMLDLEDSLQGSSFWEPRLTELADDRERFYDTYFESDIPDEWSSSDRQKSHGTGIVPCGPVDYSIMLSKTFERWFLRIPSVTLPNGIEQAVENFKKAWSIPVDIESAIHERYETKQH